MRFALWLVFVVGCGGSSAALHAADDGGDEGSVSGDDAGVAGWYLDPAK